MATPIENAGVRVGEVTGYRIWRVDGYRLRSITMSDVIWYPGEPMIGEPDNYPRGVYAFSELHGMYRELANSYQVANQFGSVNGLVGGEVKMWGTVVEHRHGYRAEFAKITKLFNGSIEPDHLNALRLLYLSREVPIDEPRIVPVLRVYRSPDRFDRYDSADLLGVVDGPLKRGSLKATEHCYAPTSFEYPPPLTVNPHVYHFTVEEGSYKGSPKRPAVIVDADDPGIKFLNLIPGWLPLHPEAPRC